MPTITGLTAERMAIIEGQSVISGEVVGDDLILETKAGALINAGEVKGPQGDPGPPGSISSSPAGGALAGNYPNPTLADGAVTMAKLAAALQAYLLPVGSFVDYGGDDVPTGFLAADGSNVSRTTYSALFAKYGTKYGIGDGSTTFTLPDQRNLSRVGASGTKPLASMGGGTIILTAANLPPHTHTMNHTHSIEMSVANTSGGSTVRAGRSVAGTGDATGSAVNSFTGNTGSGPGTSEPIEFDAPYLAVNVLIKY